MSISSRASLALSPAGSRLTLCALAVALACAGGRAQAEGSAQFGLNQPMLDAEGSIGFGYATDDASSSLFVDILAVGETINIALCGSVAADASEVQVFAPSDDRLLDTLTLTAANIACDDPMDGPIATPLQFDTSGPGELGAYRLRLLNTSQGGNAGVFERYDISVTRNSATLPDLSANADPADTLPGRLWAYNYAFYTRSFAESRSTDVNLFTLVPGGRPDTSYIWELDLNNFAGNAFNLVANSIGADAPDSGYSVNIDEDGVRKNVDYQWPIYTSIPAIADPRPVSEPSLDNVVFRDVEGNDYTISPGGTAGVSDSGQFRFDTDVEGTYGILIDLNQNGVYGDAGDRQLIGPAVIGSNVVDFDALDANGEPIGDGTYFAQVTVRMGEYHFIGNDVETSGGPAEPGLTVYGVTKAGVRSDTQVYWDDITRLDGTVLERSSNTPEGGRSGTPEGSHTWGDFSGNANGLGEGRFIDTYVYGLASTAYAPLGITDDDTPPVNFDGSLDADRDSLPGDDIAITVEDVDLDLNPGVADTARVTVVNDATGQTETVTLNETTPDSAVFTGTLSTSAGLVAEADDDGSMVTRADDTLTITYIDLINAAGDSVTLEQQHDVALDTDGDGTPNAIDPDDDNDGILDVEEEIGRAHV